MAPIGIARMSGRSLVLLAVSAVALVVVGCDGGRDPFDPGPGVGGVVRLDASLADGSGNPAGTRTVTTADGIRVWLTQESHETDSVLTFHGAYAFIGLHAGQTYRVRVRVTPGFADSSAPVVAGGVQAQYLDTLRLGRRGDLTSWPNPSTAGVGLRFALPADTPVRGEIFDLSTRHVRTLFDRTFVAGAHQVVWDGTDDTGASVADGMYWAILALPGETRADLIIRGP